MSGPSYSTPAAPMDAPSQQQLSPREGWQQLMSARHAQQQQQQQQQQPRRSPRTEGRSPREQPPPAAASRTSGAADLAVAERQPSVALKIGRLLSGAAASASAAWGHLVGGGSRSGWVDAEQLRQLQEREQEAKQKARHKEVRAAAGPIPGAMTGLLQAGSWLACMVCTPYMAANNSAHPATTALVHINCFHNACFVNGTMIGFSGCHRRRRGRHPGHSR
jgi:hypothetical protein